MIFFTHPQDEKSKQKEPLSNICIICSLTGSGSSYTWV